MNIKLSYTFCSDSVGLSEHDIIGKLEKDLYDVKMNKTKLSEHDILRC